jgi:hypothetical protein
VSIWYRSSTTNTDFYRKNTAFRSVKFINMYQWDLVKDITIFYVKGRKSGITITVCMECAGPSAKLKKLKQSIKKWIESSIENSEINFSTNKPQKSFGLYEYHFEFHSSKEFERFLFLLQYVNKQFEEKVFAAEIINGVIMVRIVLALFLICY